MLSTATYNSKCQKPIHMQEDICFYLLYFAVYYARSRIIRTWYLVSDRLEKVLFICIIHGNFKASVLRCINTSISKFSAKNKPILQENMIYLGPSWPGRVQADQGISSVVNKYQYIRVFCQKIGRKQADFTGITRNGFLELPLFVQCQRRKFSSNKQTQAEIT